MSSDLSKDHTSEKMPFTTFDVPKFSSFMDVKEILLFTLLAFSVYAFVFFIKLALKRRHYNKLLPGKKVGLFDLFGNSFDFPLGKTPKKGYPPFNAMLLEAVCGYFKLFEKKDLFCMWMSFTPCIGIVKADAVEALTSGTKTMEKGYVYNFLHPWLGTGLLTSHGSKWKSRRKLLTPAFHFDILKDFLPIFNEQAQKLVTHFRKNENKEFMEINTPIILCSLDIICETTLGVSINAQENSESEYVKAVSRASEIMMERMGNIFHWPDFIFRFSQNGKRLKRDLELLHGFTRSVIREKKNKLLSGTDSGTSTQKRKALMDLLLEHHIQTKSLTEEDIREEVDTFAFEGHDTTSMGMCWALYLIGLYKDVQEKVLEEIDSIFGDDVERPVTTDDLKDMKYLDRVLKECQRLYPSVPGIARQITEDVNICGYDVPKGAICFIVAYHLHRDKDVFPDPEKFDPDRFLPENCKDRHPYAYIPFSAGPRNCIGQRFALMEEKVVVSTILRNFTLQSLDERDKVLPAFELILRPIEPLRLRIRPRHITKM